VESRGEVEIRLLTISFPCIAKGRDGGEPVLFGLGEEDKDRSRSLRDDNKKGNGKSDSNSNRKSKSQMRGSSVRSECRQWR
jgi:hypothetical protein